MTVSWFLFLSSSLVFTLTVLLCCLNHGFLSLIIESLWLSFFVSSTESDYVEEILKFGTLQWLQESQFEQIMFHSSHPSMKLVKPVFKDFSLMFFWFPLTRLVISSSREAKKASSKDFFSYILKCFRFSSVIFLFLWFSFRSSYLSHPSLLLVRFLMINKQFLLIEIEI